MPRALQWPYGGAGLSYDRGNPLLLKLTEVPLLLWDVPLSTFVLEGSALGGLRNEPKGLQIGASEVRDERIK